MFRMSFKILNSYLSKELPLTGPVLFFTVRQAISFSTSYSRDLRSSGILLSVEGYFCYDVSGRLIDPVIKGKNFFLTLEDGTNRLSGKVGIYVDRIHIEAETWNHASFSRLFSCFKRLLQTNVRLLTQCISQTFWNRDEKCMFKRTEHFRHS